MLPQTLVKSDFVAAPNIVEFARLLSERSGCEVKGFQAFAERADEKQKMEEILAEHGTVLEMEPFLRGELKPAGLVVVYLDPAAQGATLYEMDEMVSDNWRNRR
jgi:hypothetical protein